MSAIEWIGMSKAQLVFGYEIFKMCDVLGFAQQVTNVLRLSPFVVICRNVLYFPLQSSECELLAFLIEISIYKTGNLSIEIQQGS